MLLLDSFKDNLLDWSHAKSVESVSMFYRKINKILLELVSKCPMGPISYTWLGKGLDEFVIVLACKGAQSGLTHTGRLLVMVFKSSCFVFTWEPSICGGENTFLAHVPTLIILNWTRLPPFNVHKYCWLSMQMIVVKWLPCKPTWVLSNMQIIMSSRVKGNKIWIIRSMKGSWWVAAAGWVSP